MLARRRDQAIGFLAAGPMSIHQALLFRQLSANVTYLVHTAAEPGAEDSSRLAAQDIVVVRGRVASLDVTQARRRPPGGAENPSVRNPRR